jgi:hypothetical protein
MGSNETKRLAKTPADEESGGVGTPALGEGAGDDVGVGVQAAGGVPDVGEGVVGGV